MTLYKHILYINATTLNFEQKHLKLSTKENTMDTRINIAIVGGNWNEGGGRSSSYVYKLADSLIEAGANMKLRNGGDAPTLPEFVSGDWLKDQDAVIWMPNVPNDLPKVRDVKKYHPHILLVAAKRNDGEYSIQEVINRALGLKANLIIDFGHDGNLVSARLMDVLGVGWQDHTTSIPILGQGLVKRLIELRSFTRQNTTQISGESVTVPSQEIFFPLVRDYADVFHSLIAPEGSVTRFLGNSSFRCARGFPSLRDTKGGLIFMSRRNVDKRFIDASAFVAVEEKDGELLYWGPNKPSVDTPIQVKLYSSFSKINYMLHAHVYLEGSPFTSNPIPCGALEEADEILSLIKDRDTTFASVNLLGHGCLIMADDAAKMRNLSFAARLMPEFIKAD